MYVKSYNYFVILTLKYIFKNPNSILIFQSVTESFGTAISSLNKVHLTDGVIRRSKRMMLDTLGVGLIGTRTPVFNMIYQYSKVTTLTLHISVYR